jgi:hypothetical protein
MPTYHFTAFRFVLPILWLLCFAGYANGQSKNNKYACSEPDPAQLCDEGNTCGSDSTPCTVDVKRTSYSASSTPRIQNAKSNALFCVHSGVKVTWLSTGKNIGFVVDIGPVSPFEPEGTIIGGSDRSVTVVAHKSGCYKYSAGACMSGAIKGMCGQSNAELIIVP